MNTAASFKACLRAFLALFVVALTVATLTRPLNRAKFNFAPEAGQAHQEISRHTYLEVTGSRPHIAAPDVHFISDDMRLIIQTHLRIPEPIIAHQPDNWPFVYSEIYRRLPPPTSATPIPAPSPFSPRSGLEPAA
jgi:hypothetical protein